MKCSRARVAAAHHHKTHKRMQINFTFCNNNSLYSTTAKRSQFFFFFTFFFPSFHSTLLSVLLRHDMIEARSRRMCSQFDVSEYIKVHKIIGPIFFFNTKRFFTFLSILSLLSTTQKLTSIRLTQVVDVVNSLLSRPTTFEWTERKKNEGIENVQY